MAALSAISVGVIVVVGGVQAAVKAEFFICDCAKFDLLPAPPSYSLLPVEYRERFPFILLVPVDVSQYPVFFISTGHAGVIYVPGVSVSPAVGPPDYTTREGI